MKITSSTSITSMSGTMLISPIGVLLFLESKLAKAMVDRSFGEGAPPWRLAPLELE